MAKSTFGCGSFLPGLSPGNIPNFDNGGTVDSGGGITRPPSEPSDPGITPPFVDPVGGDIPFGSIPGTPTGPIISPGAPIGGGTTPGTGGPPPPPPPPPVPGPGTLGPIGGPTTGPTGGSVTPGSVGECYCKPNSQVPYKYQKQQLPNQTEEGKVCVRTRVVAYFSYTCAKLQPGQSKPADPAKTWYPVPPVGGSIESIGKPKQGTSTCGPRNGVCAGSCGDTTVTYIEKVCISDQEVPFTGGGVTTAPGEGPPSPPQGPDVPDEPDGPVVPDGNAGQGGVIGKLPRPESGVTDDSVLKGVIDLNNPTFIANALKQKPFGIQDSKVAFQTTPDPVKLVSNDTEYTELFNKKINSNLYYTLKNTNKGGNWESTKAAGITPEVIYDNLKPEVKQLLGKIKNYDGTDLSINQIFNMIGSRVLDGTVGNLSISYLTRLAEDSQKRVPVVIKKSVLPQVNEVAAMSLIDNHKFTLDKNQLAGRDQEIIKNWKVLPSDVDMHIPITINGVEKKYYINDDGTFIDNNSLSLQDGDFINITIGGRTQKLFAESEKDHAFLLPEKIRQNIINLLGGDGGRILTASASPSVASSIEFDSSLSSPRQEYYLLSANLETLNTKPALTGSFLLKDTTVEYGIVDTSTVAGKQAADEYIKYKANKRVFVLDDSDLLLDYVESTGKINLTQTDMIFDSPKENKTVPLLTRQIPWFILLYPTNRSDYNLFNEKSQIQEIESDGTITRILRCKTSIVPEFSNTQTNKFIRYATIGRDAVDVYGNKDTQARQTVINVEDSEFKTAYRDGGALKSSSEYTHNRQKTSFRLLKEIITELDTNYELSINGIGKSLTEFDVYSRLNLQQFNKLSRIENFNTIKDSLQNGFINNVKVIPPISRANSRISFKGTQLVQRKRGAGADTFRSIKSTNTGEMIVPPDTEGQGGFEPGR